MIKRILSVILISCAAHTMTAQTPTRVTVAVSEKQLERCPDGPYEATWQSMAENYQVPEWFKDAKFGIFIHWGLYSVPAMGSEWYPKHMYNAMWGDHRKHFGDQLHFGYKDFIPKFRAENFDAHEWAALFREAGARYVIPTAEHHDGFAMYDTKYSKWNAKKMGPRRDVIGELAEAVRSEGMKFGVSNHRIENWDFMYPLKSHPDSTDLFLPKYAGLYGPPQQPTEQSAMGPKAQAAAVSGATEAIIDEAAQEGRHPQSDAFLNEWEMRVHELIDKYQPDLLYFDNGINYRSLDPWKLRLAQYYYNSASHWGREVSIQSKSQAYLAGSIRDYERESRAPKQLTDDYWQVDDPIGHKFGYVEGLKLQSADGIICSLVENVSKNGNLCLNVSPRADGTIPDDQREVLLAVGRWLKTYGEGVYGTRACQVFGEGNIRYTQKDSCIYAFVMKWDGQPFTIHTLTVHDVESVTDMATGQPVSCSAATDGGVRIDAQGQPNNAAAGFCIKVKKGRRFLFIGDSITDGGWGRSGGSAAPSNQRNHWDQNHLYGHSFMMLCAARWKSDHPELESQFFNRGISGNTLSDLTGRWQKDALDLKPDVVTLLIGTNDVSELLDGKTTFTLQQWETDYRRLLDQLRTQNPQVQLLLCTPFVAPSGKTGSADNYPRRKALIADCAQAVRRIANDYHAILLDYNQLFDRLTEQHPTRWIWDGIHPTPAGHQKMADLWLSQFTKK